jgi:AAA family ATP:ADP antiporter
MYKKIAMRVNPAEWYPVALSFAYYFCVLAAYYVMRPVRDQLAAEVGSQKLLGFFGITFVTTLLLTPLFSWLVSRWPRRKVIPFIYLLFIGCQLAFISLMHSLSPVVVGALFFVWVSVFNLFAVSVFWSFMTDIWSDTQARRLFPLIAFGGATGAVLGPILTKSLVAVIGSGMLLLVSAAFLVVAIGSVFLLNQWAHVFGAHRQEKGSEDELGGTMWEGLKQLFTNPFIRSMAVIMLLSDAIGTIAYVLITDYSGATFPHDPIAQTRFAANIDLTTNILQIFIQLTATRWLLANYGARGAFAVSACLVVATCLAMGISHATVGPLLGPFPFVAIVLILTRALGYGMIQPARETLYTLVPRSLRYKGKNAVDTAVWRGGDVLSLLFVQGFKGFGLTTAGFGILWAFLAAVSGAIGVRLATQVEKTVMSENGES